MSQAHDVERLTVDPASARQRLDRYLAALGRWGSRAQVQRLIAEGHVRLDHQPAKPGTAVRAGQIIEVEAVARSVPCGVVPEAIPLDVLYEDDWLLVINKPPGMVVHPAPGHRQGTLVSALLHRWQGLPPGLDQLRPGIVHRLDKDTSGVLVIAKDAATLADLGAQFRQRQVEKQYVAAVWGRLRHARGTITDPIGRNRVHRQRMAVRGGGRAAETRFEVVAALGDITVVRLFPRTGRTHQIRVHLSAIGHPVVGDRLYGGARGRHGKGPPPIGRQGLHAERLTLRHPHSGERLTFTARVPDDLLALCGGAVGAISPLPSGGSLDNE